MASTTLYLGELWHSPDTPQALDAAPHLVCFAQGALAVDEAGHIVAIGDAATVKSQYPQARIVDYGDDIILPGFVDAHVHFPQLDMIGAPGERLLGWLHTYTYPAESRFSDPNHATAVAARFVTELLANGTTTAAIFGSNHLQSAEALFKECDRRGIRAIIGKTSMDRGAPAALLQDVAADVEANQRLIDTWHGRDGRLFVALTPRFALSCSEPLLRALGDLKHRHADLYVQTHHAETSDEVAATAQLFPGDRDYLSVYDRFDLVGDRTLLGHCIHADDAELELIAHRKARVAHCPSSNLFLGSGLFPAQRFMRAGIPIALGTDIGAGTSLSLLRTMSEAYKIQKLQGYAPTPDQLLYWATLGGARALDLDATTGSFEPGKDADFQVLSWRRSRLLEARPASVASPAERLFALITLGDDRLTRAVYVRGHEVFSQ